MKPHCEGHEKFKQIMNENSLYDDLIQHGGLKYLIISKHIK